MILAIDILKGIIENYKLNINEQMFFCYYKIKYEKNINNNTFRGVNHILFANMYGY